MARRQAAPKREIQPDPKYHSTLVRKFINFIMIEGKKSTAERIVYGALKMLGEKAKKTKKTENEQNEVNVSKNLSPLAHFEQALNNVCPTVEVRSRRVGGATYQVPVEVKRERSLTLGMRWIIQASRNRSDKGMILRLAAELIDALENKGTAVKKREDAHKMAKANQAFAHFRWN